MNNTEREKLIKEKETIYETAMAEYSKVKAAIIFKGADEAYSLLNDANIKVIRAWKDYQEIYAKLNGYGLGI